MTGGANIMNIGVIYAANGGVFMAGNTTYAGSVTAAGPGCTVKLVGNAGVNYRAENRGFAPAAPTFVFDKLRDWNTLQ